MKGILRCLCAILLWLAICPVQVLADCATIADPIDTDRPDTPDDSPTVPPGSLQIENGVGVSRGAGVTSVDLPETRLRLGLSACTEFLLDLPDYSRAVGHGAHGFGDIAPGIKHQFEDLPEPFQLWGAVGVALPSGNQQIAGRDAQPYIQIPASVDLTAGLTLAAQYLATFHPGDVDGSTEHQASLDLEADITDDLGLFLEYTGTYRHGSAPSNTADLGATYRLTDLHQVDILVGKGLNAAAPDWYVTIGYSLRFDQLF
jgi:hypothetical protein